MTAPAVRSSSPVPAVSPTGPRNVAHAAAAPFEHQLQAARQRSVPHVQEHAPEHAAHAERSAKSSRDRTAPSAGADGHHATQARAKQDSHGVAASGEHGRVPAAASRLAADTPATAAANAAPPLAEAGAGAASGEAATVDKDADGEEQDAAALVGAMLALLVPMADKGSTPEANGAQGAAGQLVAADGSAAALLQGGDAAVAAAADGPASTVIAAQLLAADAASVAPKNTHDDARVDASQSIALSAPAPVTLAAPVSVTVAAPAGGQAFAQELGQQVAWFVGHGITEARVRLHPEELGSLDLKISVSHDRVNVVFHAQHPGAVNAVQQSLPQLEQMLAQHGLSLGNAEVGQQDRGNHHGHAQRGGGVVEAGDVHGASLVTPLGQLGLLDAFA